MDNRLPDIGLVIDTTQQELPAIGTPDKVAVQRFEEERGLQHNAHMSDYAAARLERAKALAEGRVDEQPTLGGERTFYANITKRE